MSLRYSKTRFIFIASRICFQYKEILLPERCNFFTHYKMSFDYCNGPYREVVLSYIFHETFLSWVLTVRISECEIVRLFFSLVFPSLHLPRDGLQFANNAKSMFSMKQKKYSKVSPYLCYEKVSSSASTLDSIVLENSLSASVETTPR